MLDIAKNQSRILTPELTPDCDEIISEHLNMGFHFYIDHDPTINFYIKNNEFMESRTLLRDTVLKYKPEIVCFVGKAAFEHYFKIRGGAVYGIQGDELRIGSKKRHLSRVFLLPSTIETPKNILERASRFVSIKYIWIIIEVFSHFYTISIYF